MEGLLLSLQLTSPASLLKPCAGFAFKSFDIELLSITLKKFKIILWSVMQMPNCITALRLFNLAMQNHKMLDKR